MCIHVLVCVRVCVSLCVLCELVSVCWGWLVCKVARVFVCVCVYLVLCRVCLCVCVRVFVCVCLRVLFRVRASDFVSVCLWMCLRV